MNDGWLDTCVDKVLQFFAEVAQRFVAPVHVLRRQFGNILLRAAQVPAQLVKGAALRVPFTPDDFSMLFLRNRPFGGVAHLGPLGRASCRGRGSISVGA